MDRRNFPTPGGAQMMGFETCESGGSEDPGWAYPTGGDEEEWI
jgi:hypothetical protein